MEKFTYENVEAIANACLVDMNTIRDLKGITTEEMEAVYAVAFNFYNAGAYEDAEKIFRFLVMFDHMTGKYWIGLAAVLQATKRYEEAISKYAMASFLNIHDPKPQYHIAECLFLTGDIAGARSALDSLRQFADASTDRGKMYLKSADDLEARMSFSKQQSNSEKEESKS